MNTNALSNAVADAVVNPAVVTATLTAAEREAKLEAEIARLKAEQESLTKPAAAAPKPAAKKPVTACNGLGYPAGATAADKAILDLIHQFKATDPKYLKPGRPTGTFAVKVHGFLHAAGIPEDTIRAAVAAAEDRKMISKLAIPVKNGSKNMMLLFDARERPAVKFADREQVSAEVKARFAAAFGMK